MAPLPVFPLPLPPNKVPDGYGWEEGEMSVLSTTTAFNTGIDQRDTFLGERRCIICGETGHVLQHCHIIMDSEPDTWSDLKSRGWIPSRVKDLPGHEPRNGLIMCSNHHLLFDAYDFFIRFIPETRKFVFINYSNQFSLAQFHGKAIALDINHHHAPYPALFIIHEMRVRGFNPFYPIDTDVANEGTWQDWVYSEGVFDDLSGSFKRAGPPSNANLANSQIQFNPTTACADAVSPGRRRIVLNAGAINDILAATRAMPSWKACQIEGTSWTGTAEENIEEYVSSIGVDGDRP